MIDEIVFILGYLTLMTLSAVALLMMLIVILLTIDGIKRIRSANKTVCCS